MPVPDDADYPESFRSNNRRRSHGRYQPAANDEPDSKETRAGHVDSRPSSSDKTLLAESGRPGDGKEGWEADYQEKFVEDLPDAEDADAEAYIRGVVPETDDPDMPVFTFRVLVLGTFWGVFLSSANAVLAFRTNNYNMGYFLASLLSYPMGLAMAKFLPYGIMNPGPFNIKEHVLLFAIASAAGTAPYGMSNVVTQKLWMNQDSLNIWHSGLFIFATQFVGFGLAGVARNFLIKPMGMLWPTTFSHVAMFVSFHESRDPGADGSRGGMSRYKYFWIMFAVMFVYTWIPEYFVVALQSISVLCLLTSNKFIRFMASADNEEGVGLGAMTFDWAYIMGVHMTQPFWATINFLIGNVLWSWILAPLLMYKDWFGPDSQLSVATFEDGTPMPTLNSVELFARNGTKIEARALYDETTFDVNLEVYNAYAPIRITPLYSLYYSSLLLSTAASLTHVWLWYGKSIKRQIACIMRPAENGDPYDDVHNQMMRSYKDIPLWWFATFLVLTVLVQIVVSEITPFQLPVWGVLLAIGLAAVFTIPVGIIMAISGTQIPLETIAEFIVGFIIPGKTIAVMTFKSISANAITQAIALLADLKLGHYMKIPPRTMVAAQLYGTLISVICSTGATWWVMQGMNGMVGKGDWQALNYRTFYTGGAIAGAVGTWRFWGPEGPYFSLLLAIPIGFVLPAVVWYGNKKWPHWVWQYTNVPLIAWFWGPGGVQNFYITPVIVAFFSQFWAFRYRHGWWQKYNYILSAAFDAGSAIAILAITGLANAGIFAPTWWGNPDIGAGVPLDYYCLGMSPEGRPHSEL
ncbi:hypothetical protein CXG81DRAFT_9074 [Caulochytrium protostelioides]|uniref:OPT superfamily oligopeptide transporter n=1 Tax=Caulochytrium protostelioides TaxID=1555241 RepID=A0A4P9XE05_9FUNG|nr:hypothetical protein CXG81DRAFT_9074 [Caulochytrium protostelioides]|eukprot:RKP03764.1 hypothetical protein CXG81DRAFT_9074 [Caulochytrium protostelioides]